VRVVDSTESTNADVAAAARSGADEGLGVVAEYQTGGRGRLARTWVSPPRAGLTFSVLLRPPRLTGWIPLLAGVAIAHALRESSLARQTSLAEFIFLRKNVDWFKMRQSQKLISLNLEKRRQQKSQDDAYRKAFDTEKAQLAKNDFPYREFRLGPPAQPKIRAKKKAGDDSQGLDGDDDEALSTDENDAYAKVDVPLRESLRVVNDAVVLGKDQQYWASNHAPLTAQLERKG